MTTAPKVGDERGFLRRLRANFVQWSRLENWARVAGLTFGSLGALAALSALSFFALEPRVDWGVGCVDVIDGQRLREQYATEGLDPPAAVVAIADKYASENRFSVFPDYVPLSQFPESFAPGEEPFPGLVDPYISGECLPPLSAEQLGSLMAGEPFSRQNSMPNFVVDAKLSDLEPSDKLSAAESLQDSRFQSVTIRLRNTGEAPTEVTVFAPSGYGGDRGPFELEPGRTQSVVLRNHGDFLAFSSGEFSVAWSRSVVLDRSFLQVAAALAILLIVIATVWDIAGPKNGWRDLRTSLNE